MFLGLVDDEVFSDQKAAMSVFLFEFFYIKFFIILSLSAFSLFGCSFYLGDYLMTPFAERSHSIRDINPLLR